MIIRDLENDSSEQFDVIIVGGGIYGAMSLLECCRRGMKSLLIECNDFGGATSWNSLRIIHGGLRYLQSMDLRRFKTSVRERAWFVNNFPDHVKPLPCMMPLYNDGLKRPSVFQWALKLNDTLVRRWGSTSQLDASRVLSPSEVLRRFSGANEQGLRGGALWHDALLVNPSRLIMEILHWASSMGGKAWNYVQAETLLVSNGKINGVTVKDREFGRTLDLKTTKVINCAGPWSRKIGHRFDQDVPKLMSSSLAFNLVLDRPPLSDCALAVRAKKKNSNMFFLVPMNGLQVAGTFHAGWNGDPEHAPPPGSLIQLFLNELNEAVPSWDLKLDDVLRVHSGLIPTRIPGDRRPSTKSRIVDHANHGGVEGLVSVSGIKYTTARAIAEKAVRRLVGKGNKKPLPERPSCGLDFDLQKLPEVQAGEPTEQLAESIRKLVRNESVLHLDDLLLRRTAWADDVQNIETIAHRTFDLLGWSETLRAEELDRVMAIHPIERAMTNA